MGTASFSVTVVSGTTLTYQWLKNGVPISSANSNSFTILSVAGTDSGAYAVSVTNAGGWVTSFNAYLNIPAAIASQPQNQAVVLGANASFSVVPNGTSPFTYQWYQGTTKLGPGSTSSNLTLASVSAAKAGKYTVVVKNSYGSVTSAVVSLTVLVSQPLNQTVAVGGNPSFSVVASNTVPLAYQWSCNGTNIIGATNATLSMSNVQLTDSGLYAAAITTPAGILNSSAATLQVVNGFLGTVINTSDSGTGSLRQALLNANASSSGSRYIVFQIPGTGPFKITIAKNSPLPVVSKSMSIDATTQPGFSSAPIVQLDGSELQKSEDALAITAGGCTVKGLTISSFPGNGISLSGGSGNVIQGNFIGCARDGATPLPNGRHGILIFNCASNIIGGTNALLRNVVVDAGLDGIHIEGTSSGANQVLGNIIGLNSTGLIQEGISGNGIVVSNSAWNVIGGTNAGAGNVISSLGGDGLDIGGGGACFNVVAGNFIGTDLTGTNSAKCNGNGLTLFNAPSNTIGGLVAAAANVIGFNKQQGVAITGAGASNNVVQGNFIGTDLTGTLNLKNTAAGVYSFGAYNNMVGGKSSGAGNTIAFNNQLGVVVSGGQCAILGNSLFSNVGSPGDLSLLNGGNPGAVTPVVTGATNNTGVTWIAGVLTNSPGKTYRLEFFASPVTGDAKIFLGARNVTADATTGIATFSVTFENGNITNQYVTATATDTNGNTSQISTSRAVIFNGLPAITDAPEGFAKMAGDTASLGVEAVGFPAPAYQWRLNGNIISKATNATLTFNPLAATNAGSYTVMITNIYGTVTSSAAVVTVTNPVITLSAAAGAGAGLNSSGFTFQVSLPVGSTYVIMASTNLLNWNPISTNVAAADATAITDASATNYTRRYYRAVIW